MKHRKTLTHLSAMVVTLFAFSSLAMAQSDDWSASLKEDIEGIDAAFSGELGVYVRHLSDDQTVAHNTGQDWYLASTVKIPLAIALMQRAENEGLDLEQKLTLRDSDYVDGSGDLLWVDPGAQYSLEELNRRSIEDSDSTATDMLMRFLGEVPSMSKPRQWPLRAWVPLLLFCRYVTMLTVKYTPVSPNSAIAISLS